MKIVESAIFVLRIDSLNFFSNFEIQKKEHDAAGGTRNRVFYAVLFLTAQIIAPATDPYP